MRVSCDPCKRTCHTSELGEEGWYILVRGNRSIVSVLNPNCAEFELEAGDKKYACSQACAVKIVSRFLNESAMILHEVEVLTHA